MRAFLYSFLFVFIFSCKKNDTGTAAQSNPPDTLASGWSRINIATLDELEDIFFINSTTGFTVGGNRIYRSTDGGNTWQKVYQSSQNFVNIAMGNASNIVFVCAYSNKLITSFDGGNSFDSVTLADNALTDAFFVAPTIAYAAGKKCWKTTDAGHTWTPLFDFGTSSPNYKSLYFLNDQNGWVAAVPSILYSTTNGGMGWGTAGIDAFSSGLSGNTSFSDNTHGFVSEFLGVWKTSNGGTSWNKVFTPAYSTYHDIHFLTANLGYVTDAGLIWKTTDGGNNWTREVKLGDAGLMELHFTDMNHGWACGSTGTVLKYVN